jgi:hypothetical protein
MTDAEIDLCMWDRDRLVAALLQARAERDAMAERCERLRKRASENIDAAGLRGLYNALEEENWHTENEAVQRLANTVVERDAMRKVLEQVEWGGRGGGVCIDCGANEPSHEPDCALAKALGR